MYYRWFETPWCPYDVISMAWGKMDNISLMVGNHVECMITRSTNNVMISDTLAHHASSLALLQAIAFRLLCAITCKCALYIFFEINLRRFATNHMTCRHQIISGYNVVIPRYNYMYLAFNTLVLSWTNTCHVSLSQIIRIIWRDVSTVTHSTSISKLGHHRLSWWRHQMEIFSALLVICAGNSPVPGEFPAQRPVTRNFDVFCDLRLNKRLSKQSRGWWFETLSCSLWRHCNVFAATNYLTQCWLIALRGYVCQKQVSRAGIIDYIPKIL